MLGCAAVCGEFSAQLSLFDFDLTAGGANRDGAARWRAEGRGIIFKCGSLTGT